MNLKTFFFLLIISILLALTVCGCNSGEHNINETAVGTVDKVTSSKEETDDTSLETEATETNETESQEIIPDDNDLEIITVIQTQPAENTEAFSEAFTEATSAPSSETNPTEKETYIELPFVPAQ